MVHLKRLNSCVGIYMHDTNYNALFIQTIFKTLSNIKSSSFEIKDTSNQYTYVCPTLNVRCGLAENNYYRLYIGRWGILEQ